MPDLLTFGDHTLDPDTGELRLAGRPVPLAAQPATLLVLLAQRAGELVTRREIRRHLWGDDVHVDYEQGINAAVRQVRQALGDDAASPRFVETVPRRGYRFLPPVEMTQTRPARPRRRWLPRMVRLAAVTLLPLVAAVAVFATWIGGRDAGGAGEAPRLRADGRAAVPRLVVLPFANLSGDPADAWLSQGLAEDLSTSLSRRYAAQLGVIARTSAAAWEPRAALDEVARRLRVDYAVEGSVRRQGEELRVSARLLRARDGAQLWAGSYDRPLVDVLAVQREVGEKIARALALHVLPEPLAGGGADPRAYEAYLRGRHLLSRRGGGRDPAAALRWLEQAVEIDPAFSDGWVELARALRFRLPPRQGIGRVREALERALALDDGSAPAHLLAAQVAFYYDWDLDAAGRHYRRALEIHPAYAEAHHAYAAWFSVQGRHDEALAEVERALSLDPLSPMVASDVGWYRYFAGDWDGAVEASRRTLEQAPGFFWARRSLLLALVQAGDLEAAAVEARREMEADAGVARAATALRLARRDAEMAVEPAVALDAYWRWRLAERGAQAEEGYVSPAFFADLHMARGDREAALAALERAFEERSGWILPFLSVHPLYAPLRTDPRFQDLVERIRGG